ncbi:MAG TPA: PQQ-binding-like beta-propeller repeat protein [Pyrinomonadaceae bacterium]|nr:PQQ-binding-like beta-propeller repeat protein [Pyrinomonadaceae bacterium]
MFEQKTSPPWYKSRTLLISAGVVVVLAVAVVGVWKYLRNQSIEAHYDALEENRRQQAAQAPPVPVATTAPVAQASPGASPDQAAGATAAAPVRNYWTNFRGPKRDGNYEEKPVLTSWPASGLTALWKQPVGLGYSSFSVADGRAYTIEQRRGQEVVAAYEVNTGRELWTQRWNAEYSPGDDTGDGPRTTPTWDQGRLYALGGTGELRCLDANTGAVIWGKNILADNQAPNLQWGVAGSPLIVDDKVIVLPGGANNKSVVAYNKMTGAPVWKALSDQQAYVSPMLVELAGRRQIIDVTASRVVALAPENGALLWSYPWDTSMGINVSQPIIVDKNRFFMSSGYGKGAALVEVKGTGQNFTATTVWENINMKNKFNSSVFYNGYIYGLDEGILTCLDVNTGERKWKGGRYGYGQVLVASGNLIVTSDTGDLALVKASPDAYTELSRFPALQGKTWNIPAIADGRLLVRNANEMAAYDISRK